MSAGRMEDAEAYEVLARSTPGAALAHIGVVFAANTALATTYARWLYDEEAWTEMCVVRRRDLIPVDSRRSKRTVRRSAR